MTEGISPREARIVQKIQSKNIPHREALITLILLTRAYSRPSGDLAETLRHYPGLEDTASVHKALRSLETRGWLTRETSYGVDILGPANNLREIIGQLCEEPSLAQDLIELRRINDDYVTVIGPLRDKHAFVSYLNLLRTAQNYIYMPILATAPDGLDSVPILIERALAGVEVHILAATPKLAARVRGAQMNNIAEQRIHEWQQIARKSKNIKLRLTGEPRDLLLATSLCIDGRVLRVAVYDFLKERSKEGVIVEFSSSVGKPLNIIQFFEEEFRSAWKAARPVEIPPKILWYIGRFWQFWVASFFTLLTYFPYVLLGEDGIWRTNDDVVSLLTAIFSSIAASFMFAGIVESNSGLSRKRSSIQ